MILLGTWFSKLVFIVFTNGFSWGLRVLVQETHVKKNGGKEAMAIRRFMNPEGLFCR
jgi:hypothetical protein